MYQFAVGLFSTNDGESPLQLAIKRRLAVVVDALCIRGADMSATDSNDDCPLWLALQDGECWFIYFFRVDNFFFISKKPSIEEKKLLLAGLILYIYMLRKNNLIIYNKKMFRRLIWK